MNVNYAVFMDNYAYLSEDFGRDLALKKFDLCEEQLEKIVGRYTRGKRKGKLRGKIVWTKCVKGGWVKTGPYDFDADRANGYVASKGKCDNFLLVDAWTGEPIIWSKDNLKKSA